MKSQKSVEKPILIQPIYNSRDETRQFELEFCIEANKINEHLEYVPFYTPDSVRPTYSAIIKYAQKFYDNRVVIIANTDIFFDESVSICNLIQPSQFWALSRWEFNLLANPVHYNNNSSQDVWVFRTPHKFKHLDNLLNIPLGTPGCDNRLAYIARHCGYDVLNPSLIVKSYHFHCSGYRTYTQKDTIPRPYLFVSATDTLLYNKKHLYESR